MEAANPYYKTAVERIFHDAAFIGDVGIELIDCGPGWCETRLIIAPRHLQQTGVIHAGVQTTIADHTAGGAAITLMREGEHVLTAEFKLNLLRAGQGGSLWCRAQVLKPGRSLSFVESEVYAVTGEERILISKLTATMAVMRKR
ncbi:MAG: phenylacetic acid degradation protein PaaI [Burkholderiales bacterium RIFCSPLOWO2_02_FULL_57_36]|nr:MAG: phenylacetic acid degradation protein PaaI [Burkholderiales bacterium RIFCSPLOWO2_02_FULL_57_36]